MQTAGDWTEAAGGSRISGVAGSYSLTTAFDKSESIGWDRTTKIKNNDLESVGLAKVSSSTKRSDLVATVHTMSSGTSTEIMSGGIVRIAGAQIILDADSIILMTRAGPITLSSVAGIAASAAAGMTMNVEGDMAMNIVGAASINTVTTSITSSGDTTIVGSMVNINP